MNWLIRCTLGVLVLFCLCAAVLYWLLARSVPDTSKTAVEAAVSGPVRVLYDTRGRPFVYAGHFDDAYFAQGYLHAKHRLWQMDMFRRAGTGRIAELIGPPGVETDVEIWRAGVPELAHRMASVASPTLRKSIRAYVAGINQFLAQSHPLPPEYLLLQTTPKSWTSQDVFALGALMAYQSANNLSNELVRMALIQELGADKAGIFQPLTPVMPDPIKLSRARLSQAMRHAELTDGNSNELFTAPSLGSNAWAVSPALTKAGNALFAFDSHDAVSLPNLTYDVHLFVGAQQIRGNSVPGLLGVINGYNEFMAWGFTNIGDSQDVFIPPTESNEADQIETITIPVRDGQDVQVDIVTTPYGRLISDNPRIAVRWAPLEPHNYGLDALMALNRATSFAAFNAALDQFVAPSATATYADVTGRVAQRTIGLLPKRNTGAGRQPHSAITHRWTGMLDMTQLPQHETRTGYVAAANRPFTTDDQLISADNAPGYRIHQIHQVLKARDHHTVDSMLALQTDYTNLQARRLLPTMLLAIDHQSLTEKEAQAYDMLQHWLAEPTDQADQPAPLLFAGWYQQLIQYLFEPLLHPDTYKRLLRRSYLINEAIDNQLLQDKTNWPVAEALRLSFARMVAQLDAPIERLNWGGHHQLLLKHELGNAFPGASIVFNRGPYSAPGGNATVGRARYSHARPFQVSGGATTRMVLEMSEPIQAWMVSPGGQSGHPLSPWYNDQTSAWLAGTADKIEPPDKAVADILFTPIQAATN